MDRVTAQQAGPLEQIIGTAFTYHCCPQAQLLAAAGFFYQQAGQQTADPAKAVQDDILRLIQQGVASGVGRCQFTPEVVSDAGGCLLVLKSHRKFTHIDPGRGQIKLADRLDNWQGFKCRKFFINNQTGKAMGLEDVDGGAVYQ